jgi:CheY-like chemotaxis protein
MDDLPKTILIVDDTADFREIFSMKLSSAGYHIETAASGQEAVQKVKDVRPDLVLLDVKMPGMTGEEVLETIRRDPTTASTKIIFTTNLGIPGDTETDEALAKRFGADGYIKKTEDLDTVVALVGNYIGRGASKVGP